MNRGCNETGDRSGLPSFSKTLCQQGQAFKRPVCSPLDNFPRSHHSKAAMALLDFFLEIIPRGSLNPIENVGRHDDVRNWLS
ncbi:hypothetical protein TNIN_259461 [Trichonephila inaurata madagascariensis]|uniref:Uncharacterized protein n=1 Tax=Trichonephila inaurata madagascariensis TaxID=2747483 RepID=A0A8X7C2T5_9ARAC|nr:hypothetical protein TNIN_259461 [Trichonephila inaurata madagascariensis]